MTDETLLHIISYNYTCATRRLIILDYDGTLTSFKASPPEAKPSESLLRLIEKLASDPRNDIAILSGRDRATLTEWFGHLPVWLGAEHGFFVRPLGHHWHATKRADTNWKPAVRRIMEEAELPGAFIEDKAVAIAWQYRRADARHGHPVITKLLARLEEVSAEQGLTVMHGNRVIEVMPPGANKGIAALHWLEQDSYDFVLGAGDDRTDADLFAALPAEAYSIKIGHPTRHADTTLPSPSAFRDWLKTLVATPDFAAK